MAKRALRMLLALLVSTSLMTLFIYAVGIAAPARQEAPQAQDDGQEYVIQAGDWLSRISLEYLGSTAAYQIIVAATNAKAESDPRFTRITDPNQIEVGQLLWIPNQPNAAAEVDSSAAMSEAAAAETVNDGATITPAVRFVAPEDGAEVSPTFDVEMAADGITIEPAGEIHPGAGHFHILVDTDFLAPGELIPFDEQHLHFGKGQLTTTLELEPGIYVLRLQAANGAHLALAGAQYQDAITVTVTGEQAVMPTVRFVTPQDGDVVSPTFEVEMAAQGIAIEPAGEIHEGAGHFHILVDTDFVAAGDLIPFDEQHLHFGRGQLTTTLELEPGSHTLRLQAANGAHIALEGEPYRDQITVTVASGD